MNQTIFAGTLDSLEPIRDYVASNAAAAGLDRSAIYKLCLAVDEIATNVVIHGYEEAGISGDIEVSAATQENSFEIVLRDRGKPYDPDAHEQAPDTSAALPLEDRRIGGLGILLAKDSVDHLQYTTGPDGNVHRFIVKLANDGQ